ncbi:urease accessory protein UreD [Amycolatopsis mediterranei S699]|uniref:Urease accessory protein UreD n=1 Tax=Amycolatopsis mediterranei (strain U-32) TaxID=749927 RepID=A0A0H3DHF4_AMYMU|nr:urease accessory protein UreD [Amycolatopsis mediterranei]ADJ50141.1 urease accessory protein UreD [Amycolatopsis mediterranei U32]AFO81849.1 urease accessory protein UreD [Amycolatopsis mediterranei S699]AGT88978.1 urease accessory protein UreD [Amycolatopsis mediterranei RB]KDO07610.1 urease accessory protein ureD [Amycolatopsis mediterranei]KDU93495.1 urease accessory protein ureD [Amycolatopsis mediterranei]
MKAHARLTACFDGSRTVLRELRSMAPLTLFPRRRSGSTAVVHLVNSATSPLGGDDLLLSIHVGRGASLRLSGVAATLALPGLHGEESLSTVEVVVEPGGSLEYLPEPTVITARARHRAVFRASLASDAYLHTREVLVLGRAGERPGSLSTSLSVTRGSVPVLRQTLSVGDAGLDASLAVLAGRRVLATDLVVGGPELSAASGDWWSRSPLPAGGSLVTSLAPDAVTAMKGLAEAGVPAF